MNDEICARIASGKLIVKPSIEMLHGKTIYFSNGTAAENIDSIILCTGYGRHFPFLEDSVIEVQNNGKYLPLYKSMFTSKFGKSLAFVGMVAFYGSFVS